MLSVYAYGAMCCASYRVWHIVRVRVRVRVGVRVRVRVSAK